MFSMSRSKYCASISLICLAAMLAACARQREPAQMMIGEIDATISAAGTDAAKFAPDQLSDVQTKLAALKSSFDNQDYNGVLAAAPPVLSEAQGLAGAAAANKAEVTKALERQWASMASDMPASITAIQNRIDMLGTKRNRKLAAGIDLNAARSGLSGAESLWSKAQGAFGNGNMEEAVMAAKDVKSKLDALATGLKVDLPAPAAT
ncbi:MAG: hypothetical protein ACLQAR_01650 [Steroidobacteraceae bacterium]